MSILSDREHRTLVALCEAVVPGGRLIPAGDDATARRAEGVLAQGDPLEVTAIRGGLALLDAWTFARTLRPFARLDRHRREQLLAEISDRSESRHVPLRLAIRALVSVVKAAHFDDRALFARLGCVYSPDVSREKAPRWMAAVTDASTIEGPLEIACDVVVVGTGAGGAVIAKELAERGHAVAMVEEGAYYGRADFAGERLANYRKMYRHRGTFLTLGNVPIMLPTGRTVGGTTTINSGTCFRAPPDVLAQWVEQGLSDLAPERLARHYARVERLIGVGVNSPASLGRIPALVARGCERLGISDHGPLLRNAPECDGQGVCCFGCPTDAKRSTNVSYVPLALQKGARLLTGVRVERVLFDHGAAVGIEGHANGVAVRVGARATVIACGTLETPLLLVRSGLLHGRGGLGRNLTIHPAGGVAAIFDEVVDGSRGVPQGYAITQFRRSEGLTFEGAFVPLEMATASNGMVGRTLVAFAESFNHMALFGYMVSDKGSGGVRAGPGGRPVVWYSVGERDRARLQRGAVLLSRIWFEAGARRVLPAIAGWSRLDMPADVDRMARAHIPAHAMDLSAYHPLGTARMGLDPRTSVVGLDHAVHGAAGLYVVDGSVLPSSLGVNPMLTIMAMATRAAEILDGRFK